ARLYRRRQPARRPPRAVQGAGSCRKRDRSDGQEPADVSSRRRPPAPAPEDQRPRRSSPCAVPHRLAIVLPAALTLVAPLVSGFLTASLGAKPRLEIPLFHLSRPPIAISP